MAHVSQRDYDRIIAQYRKRYVLRKTANRPYARRYSNVRRYGARGRYVSQRALRRY